MPLSVGMALSYRSCTCIRGNFREFSLGGSGSGSVIRDHHHHHHQSLFIHEIVSFYMVFLGIVFKTRLKY